MQEKIDGDEILNQIIAEWHSHSLCSLIKHLIRILLENTFMWIVSAR